MQDFLSSFWVVLCVQAAAGRMLYNTAEMEKGNAGDGDTVAILEGTQLCCTRQLRDLLHCLGGTTVLLPLFAQLGWHFHISRKPVPKWEAVIVSSDCLRWHLAP